MPRKRRGPLVLNNEEREQLRAISRSQTEPIRRVERATIMLHYANGETISDITRWLDGHRSTVNRCIARALEEGLLSTLDDRPRSGRPREITPEARAWLVSLACQKPQELGYSYEPWSLELLTQHAHKSCEQEGHPSLKRVSRGTVWQVLNADKIQPHRVRYYLEKRDEQFQLKMAQVLEVYREVEQVRNAGTDPESKTAPSSRPPTVYLSYDTKPGIQATDNTAADLPSIPGKHLTLKRDHEYRRHGLVILLAGIALVTGQVLGSVRDRHRSREFIEFLENADSQYPQDARIHLILDNHSAHTSKETRASLATKLGRFEFTFTPKHGSRLNLIETFFSKMARTVLRAIRVAPKDVLKRRIGLYLQELNADPVVFRWSYGLG